MDADYPKNGVLIPRRFTDKALVLLYGSVGSLTAKQIAGAIEYANVSQFRQKVLKPAHKVDLLDFDSKTDAVNISPVGMRYVEKNIPLTV